MFDLEELKKHPYATGAVVIVGGLVVLYLLSSSSSSGSSPVAGGDPNAAYDASIAQTNAAAAVQTNAQQVQLQQNELEAQVSNTQTAAAIETNNVNTGAQLAATLAQISASTEQNKDTLTAQTTDTANQYIYAENLQQMQDSVLESQIDSGVLEDANNNATALAGVESTLDYQTKVAQLQAGIASQGLTEAGTLATQQQTDFESNVSAIIPEAGEQKNSALDATDQTGIFQTILANGSPTVAATGTTVSGSVANTGNIASATLLNSLISAAGSIGKSVTTGLLG